MANEPRPDASVANLDEVKEPRLRVTFKGKTTEYDPWKVAAFLEERKVPQTEPSVKHMDAIREAFGMPTAAAATEEAPTYSPSQCMSIMGSLYLFLKSLPEVKNLQALMQNSSTSIPASPLKNG